MRDSSNAIRSRTMTTVRKPAGQVVALRAAAAGMANAQARIAGIAAWRGGDARIGAERFEPALEQPRTRRALFVRHSLGPRSLRQLRASLSAWLQGRKDRPDTLLFRFRLPAAPSLSQRRAWRPVKCWTRAPVNSSRQRNAQNPSGQPEGRLRQVDHRGAPASWFAMNDEVVYLGDLDRRQSSRLWLEMRSAEQVAIRHWDPTEDLVAPPRDCSVAIYDTPAGLHGKRLKQLLGEVERVIVPVSPSRFDMLASRDFFDELAEAKAIRKERVGSGSSACGSMRAPTRPANWSSFWSSSSCHCLPACAVPSAMCGHSNRA